MRFDLGQGGLGLGLRPGQLVGVEDPGHAPPLGFLALGGRGHVVGSQDGLHLDALGVCHLRRHAEVHHVSRVVAVQVEHAGATVDGLGGRQHLLHRGGREDVADRAAVHEALADVPHEHRQVARSAAGCDADFSLHRGVRPDDGPLIRTHQLEPARMRKNDAFQHLVHEGKGVIDDFFHGTPPPVVCWAVRTPHLMWLCTDTDPGTRGAAISSGSAHKK